MVSHLHELVELRPTADGQRRRLDPRGLLFVGDHDARVTTISHAEVERLLRDEQAPLAEVIVLRDVLARQLSRELGVSVAFVDFCHAHGIPVDGAKTILSWFLTRAAGERMMIAKTVLRAVRKARPRR